MVEQQDYNLELQSKLDRICNGMDVMSDKQAQMLDDIGKIKRQYIIRIKACMLG